MNPFVNNWVKLFSKIYYSESFRFGVEGPSFEDRVLLTSEFGVVRSFTQTVYPDGVCRELLKWLMLRNLEGWICAAFAE